MARSASFIVTVDLPPGVSAAEMKAYIADEVQSNVGRFSPEDPMHYLDPATVKVRHAPKAKKPT